MMAYYVVFALNKKAVCGTWVRANGKELALMDAEFKMMCRYPNVKYDELYITNIKE